jgi:micrococcal nuclease
LAVPPLSPAPGSAVPGGATPARAAPDDRALRGTALRGGAPGVVVHLVDGDTLDVALQAGGRERIRLIGIDTPETKKPNHPVECFGPEASARLADLVPEGSAVLLLRDVEARDVYGRFLAYVFRASDGLFVNLDMVESGYARALRIEPNVAFADDVSRAVASARTARRGLWGVCPEVGQGSGRK